MQTSPHGLYGFCSQLCDIVPVPLSNDSHDCKRLASTGVILHNLAVVLETFASQHCTQQASHAPESVSQGGLSFYCEYLPHDACVAITWKTLHSRNFSTSLKRPFRWQALFEAFRSCTDPCERRSCSERRMQQRYHVACGPTRSSRFIYFVPAALPYSHCSCVRRSTTAVFGRI